MCPYKDTLYCQMRRLRCEISNLFDIVCEDFKIYWLLEKANNFLQEG